MRFNSLEFLFFFPCVLLGYALLYRSWKARKVLLLVSSYLFYMAWNPPFALLLVGSTFLDYIAARAMERTDRNSLRRAWVAASCMGNLGVLVFFKYSDFLLSNFWVFAPNDAAYPTFFSGLILPVGLSFYTFQSMSYTIDVYRGEQKATHDLLNFALYVSFFPQLVAGPIIRSTYFLPQLETARHPRAVDMLKGLDQIARGFAKKVIMADTLAMYVDVVYSAPGDYGAVNHVLATYAYAFQIYFDFSGYSDIAIGTAALLGFKVPANFNLPYLARGPADFWRRWHISLSTWLRDYLYISLGGSRATKWKIYRNLLITMLLGGMWHGAAWGFILWGAFHGVWLAVHRLIVRDGGLIRLPGFVSIFFPFHLVCLGWVFVRAESLADIGTILRAFTDIATPIQTVSVPALIVLAFGFLSHCLGNSKSLGLIWNSAAADVKVFAYICIIIGVLLNSGDTGQFIYFQF